MAQAVAVRFSGSLTSALADTTDVSTGECQLAQPGMSFSPTLQSATQWADAEAGSRRTTIDSDSAFVELGLPTVGSGQVFLGRLFYFRSLERGATWSVRLTYNTAGASEAQVGGTLVVEAPDGDEITLAEVEGVGAFEWFCSGTVEDA